MTPLEMMPKEQWDEILEQFARKTEMVACLGDPKGNVIQCCSERNPLCLAIRGNPEMLTFICSQASETMGAVIAKTLESELDFCHAGLIRVAVPIVRDGNMIGQVFACGLASDEEEIDISLLASQFSVSEDEVREMVKSIPVGSEKAVEGETAELYAKINAVDGER